MTTPKAIDCFIDRRFDFLIVGGGTAGLAVAARLAENPNVVVGVLEAGPDVTATGIEGIDVPGMFGTTLGTKFDWQFETTPQEGLRGRTLPWPRGKVLGGTSALNFMTWNRGNREDYDAWEELGCKGWGWDGLLPFFKKSENFHPPTEDTQLKHKALYDPDGFGTSGPIQVTYANEFSESHKSWHGTLQELGVEINEKHVMGSNVGVWTSVGSVNPTTCTRSYASTAYYLPNKHRKNLVVLPESLVEEVVLEQHQDSWVAKGVRFRHGGESHFATASREVIVCAGSVQSPQILELSGIGNPEILARAGIELKVANPNVGENLQDHPMVATIYEVDPSLRSPDDLKNDKNVAAAAHAEYVKSKSGPLTILTNSVCYLPISHVAPEKALASISSKAAQLSDEHPGRNEIRHRRFASSSKLGQIEYIFDIGNWNVYFQPDPSNGKKYATMLQILQYPFSRGNIHIQSKDPSDKPIIDPKYYVGAGGELDFEIMVHCAKFAEKITQTKPLSNIVRSRAAPSTEVSSDEALKDWVVQNTITDWHPVGTCGMGGHGGISSGVVDERLRVYGVKGLRVIDASIMPMQISAHLQATVYAIAEKGAQMILEDWAKDA
ncbi:putative choline dehydrogenase [Pseudomassariella vexata]|uniref:Putative choline dehydrogenase n=1 Tax=Pseudomassariella vexata TaxID=1141098 RepID=A0A1Y2DLY0_9PEZI|nr:putative choline dehydrogenase [Pseudomassariella vexata]ORY60270.1 putative choline dehydrogenase [Pseudomassariella vexata]